MNERDPAERCREKLSEFGGCTSEPHTVLRCLAERLSESGGCASERFGIERKPVCNPARCGRGTEKTSVQSCEMRQRYRENQCAILRDAAEVQRKPERPESQRKPERPESQRERRTGPTASYTVISDGQDQRLPTA
jgi:hypothetical protein